MSDYFSYYQQQQFQDYQNYQEGQAQEYKPDDDNLQQDNYQQEQSEQKYLYNSLKQQKTGHSKKQNQFQDSYSHPEDINQNFSETLFKNQIQPPIQQGNDLFSEDQSTIQNQNNQYQNYFPFQKNQTEQPQNDYLCSIQAQPCENSFLGEQSNISFQFDPNFSINWEAISQQQQQIKNEQQLLQQQEQQQQEQQQQEQQQQEQQQYEEEEQEVKEYGKIPQQQTLGIIKKGIQKKEPRRQQMKINKKNRPLKFAFQLLKSFLHFDGKYNETASEQKIRKNLSTTNNVMTEPEIETHIKNLKTPLQELRNKHSQYLSEEQVFDKEIKDKLLAFPTKTVKDYYTNFKKAYKKGYFNKYSNLQEEELTISHLRKEIKNFKCDLQQFSILDVIQFLYDNNN